ncbi:unnamed protein product [Cuscuta europaea]|uniref:Uncharacterized protein n=1 Tax=Cuscuta europaea TaxID=41803 RepID=A0A9P0ZER0_CUSEU|nr:unnamed protein product [Cuscuta europaea]
MSFVFLRLCSTRVIERCPPKHRTSFPSVLLPSFSLIKLQMILETLISLCYVSKFRGATDNEKRVTRGNSNSSLADRGDVGINGLGEDSVDSKGSYTPCPAN